MQKQTHVQSQHGSFWSTFHCFPRDFHQKSHQNFVLKFTLLHIQRCLNTHSSNSECSAISPELPTEFQPANKETRLRQNHDKVPILQIGMIKLLAKLNISFNFVSKAQIFEGLCIKIFCIGQIDDILCNFYGKSLPICR